MAATKPNIVLRLAFMSDFHANDEDDIDRALAMIDDALFSDTGANHVVIGGDIVDRAQQELLRRFGDGLKRRRCLGRVTIVPGNHDIFPTSKRSLGGSLIGTILGKNPTSRYKEFCRLFAGGRARRGGTKLFSNVDYPFARTLSRDVVIIAIDSTRNGVFDPRKWASGELQEADVNAARGLFATHARARHKIVVMHHCPWLAYEDAEDPRFPMGMAIPDHGTAIRWLEGTSATLVLCGHLHCRVGVETRERLGRTLRGYRAGTAGGADNDEGDDTQTYHIIDLLSNGRYKVFEREFEREELE